MKKVFEVSKKYKFSKVYGKNIHTNLMRFQFQIKAKNSIKCQRIKKPRTRDIRTPSFPTTNI